MPRRSAGSHYYTVRVYGKWGIRVNEEGVIAFALAVEVAVADFLWVDRTSTPYVADLDAVALSDLLPLVFWCWEYPGRS